MLSIDIIANDVRGRLRLSLAGKILVEQVSYALSSGTAGLPCVVLCGCPCLALQLP